MLPAAARPATSSSFESGFSKTRLFEVRRGKRKTRQELSCSRLNLQQKRSFPRPADTQFCLCRSAPPSPALPRHPGCRDSCVLYCRAASRPRRERLELVDRCRLSSSCLAIRPQTARASTTRHPNSLKGFSRATREVLFSRASG